MDSPDKPRRGRPRNPGPASQTIRIPGELVPVVRALVAAWFRKRPAPYEQRPLRTEPEQEP